MTLQKQPECNGNPPCGACTRCARIAIKRMENTGEPVMFNSPRGDADASELIKAVVGEISRMQYEGDMQAIACVIVDKDGDLRTMFSFQPKQKLPLLAGATILSRAVTDACTAFTKQRDE